MFSPPQGLDRAVRPRAAKPTAEESRAYLDLARDLLTTEPCPADRHRRLQRLRQIDEQPLQSRTALGRRRATDPLQRSHPQKAFRR